MISDKYGEAAVEVIEILDNTNQEDVNKIPKKFIEYLKENSKNGYLPNLDYTKNIDEMNLKQETKELLGIIYRNWWASPEEKKEIYNKIKEEKIARKKEQEEKYSYENLFKNNNKQIKDLTEECEISTPEPEIAMTKYKDGFFNKFIKFIKNILKK